MGENSESHRIDWFDGSLVQETRPTSSQFLDEEPFERKSPPKLQEIERKPIGFKRLLDISLLKSPILNLELSNRPGFWLLFAGELKGDFIVLLVRTLLSVYESIDPYDNSKITTALRSKFEKTDFIIKLKEYIIGIPKVKTVDKHMNVQLWDDVEAFYKSVVHLCNAIIKVDGHSRQYLEQLLDLLEETEISAVAVQVNHMEPISEEMYQQLHLIRSKLKYSLSSFNEKSLKDLKPQSSHPDNFRNLPIFPKQEDLLGDHEVPIIPNIIDGAYPSVELYLNLQFRLLREDCFGPLRDGISKYMKNPSKRRYENIRVYPKVCVTRTYVTRNKVGYLIDIARNERLNNESVNFEKYAENKWLMCGSLCLFTNDNFQNILCASVLDSSLNLLECGYIAVVFENPLSSNIFSEEYLMIESEVFFEPYHRVLKVLQIFQSEIPMRRYIVDVQKETRAPAYLSQDRLYNIQSKNGKVIEFPVLNSNLWPREQSVDLDKSQFEAYKLALTREFAVIQGPPGTGKTFIGIKIATTLLRNLTLLGTPMLIICYTNHALDQFLEGIIKVTDDVVRLGSQSKSKILEPYNLNNMRMKVKSKYSRLYATKRSELEKIFAEMSNLQTEIEKCDNLLICYKNIKPYLKIDNKNLRLRNSDEDPVLTWLFGHLDGIDYPVDELYDWENQYEEIVTDKIESCFSEEWAMKEINSMQSNIEHVKNMTDDCLEAQKRVDTFRKQIDKIEKRLSCFEKYMTSSQIENKKIKIPSVTNLYKLTTDERWQVYFKAVDELKDSEDLMIKMNQLLDKHKSCSQELEEVSTLVDAEVMKHVRVVGVTTTVMARRHDLCNKLQSPIVIVEEAAEVLEAHIVASLTRSCQHLILIGDHKQLRPTAAHYKLAKHYNLEISLFERMIRNKIHSRTLTTQRRMRKNFVELLVPMIYDKLDCHPDVLKYPSVLGMRDTLYFYNHNVFEDSEGLEDSWSHKNSYEAKWCVSLANFLRKLQYKASEITILTTYNGQASLITKMSKKYPLLDKLKITVVDNYQGEENRIIILSLVRSNKEGSVGFLSASNRICVAMSRAREGFYIFGNMSILKSASPIWRFIDDKLKAQNAIGNEITLQFAKNNENLLVITNTKELDELSMRTSCRSKKIVGYEVETVFNIIFSIGFYCMIFSFLVAYLFKR